MNKKMKKVVSFTALSTVALSAVVAVNPHQADAASTTESLVVKAEQNKVTLQRAISVDYKANAKTQPWTEYNKAKKDYTAAKTAVGKLSKKDRDRLNARLDSVKLWIDRTAVYIDAISSGKKLSGLQATLEDHLSNGDLEEMTVAYNKLSYEMKKQAAYLYKVYGKSTRETFLTTYKQPAEELKQEALYPVSIYIEINRLADALEKDDTDLADKYGNNIADWFEKIDSETLIEALSNYFVDTLSPYMDEDISTIVPADDYTFTTGQNDLNAFDAFSYFNKEGEEIYADAFAAGYTIKDDKGYFNGDGSFKDAYAEKGLSEVGTDKIQLIKTATNEVVAEKEFTIVEGLPYFSIDKGKLVDEAGKDATQAVVGQSYQFVPTEASDQNYDIIGDEPGETLKLEDFKGVTFTSSNSQVFTIDETGKITPVAAGKAKLTVTYNDMDYSILIDVVAAPAN
ncbi:Ig-like domain-containing protein [Neobacillus sp. PS3-40]|uniref:Ig-like domain-containing protein n=1 Tax=Neobacillus sp. PS3-40 TaxID=3070679 RepID=UPI0027DEE779|nr:Ig-like domain-containing protein [Neobacillus sp. PS3-40]WML46174.1 Ig-like domain-containing protein [Neobacillus sp. PS3-40]